MYTPPPPRCSAWATPITLGMVLDSPMPPHAAVLPQLLRQEQEVTATGSLETLASIAAGAMWGAAAR